MSICLRAMFESEAHRARSLANPESAAVPRSSDPTRALLGPLEHLVRTQARDGSWHGDYGGPMFLLPLYVATCRIAGVELGHDSSSEMLRYVRTHQNQDGGFGLHVEASSSVFPTALNYVAARLLGEAASAEWLTRARNWLHEHGGPVRSASWGKYFLALLNLYDYRGLNPVLPELWLLPEASPVHPSRLWCHCRMVYLPLSYLYARRASMPENDTVRALRSELYPGGYAHVDWEEARDSAGPSDRATPHSALLDLSMQVLLVFERKMPTRLRRRALRFVLEQIRYEDENTDYICIGPINKLLHTLVWHFERPGDVESRRHVERLADYLYQAADGLKLNGYNNSRLWDTAFAVQALVAADDTGRTHTTLSGAFQYLEQHQVLEDVADRERCYRHRSRGGWPFSDRAHGWPIS
ncbi:MAG TPA: prenyltransferase/squalene oxidase repeat-containing protein, partial [Polyangiaceae bacterium]|nr:prenyltransferase/squalene oxidase repeat-containing protein [Polyangiaceae bacterium]